MLNVQSFNIFTKNKNIKRLHLNIIFQNHLFKYVLTYLNRFMVGIKKKEKEKL